MTANKNKKSVTPTVKKPSKPGIKRNLHKMLYRAGGNDWKVQGGRVTMVAGHINS